MNQNIKNLQNQTNSLLQQSTILNDTDILSDDDELTQSNNIQHQNSDILKEHTLAIQYPTKSDYCNQQVPFFDPSFFEYKKNVLIISSYQKIHNKQLEQKKLNNNKTLFYKKFTNGYLIMKDPYK